MGFRGGAGPIVNLLWRRSLGCARVFETPNQGVQEVRTVLPDWAGLQSGLPKTICHHKKMFQKYAVLQPNHFMHLLLIANRWVCSPPPNCQRNDETWSVTSDHETSRLGFGEREYGQCVASSCVPMRCEKCTASSEHGL
jgi:hypothetical protein